MIWGLIDWWNLNFKFAKTPFDLESLVGSPSWTPILTAHEIGSRCTCFPCRVTKFYYGASDL